MPSTEKKEGSGKHTLKGQVDGLGKVNSPLEMRKINPTLYWPQLTCILSSDKVAIKVLDKTRLDAQSQRMLSREISSMEALQHPNVVRLYEVVETPSRMYLVLEYAGGGDLHTRITEGKLSDAVSKIVFAQILSAIKHLVSILPFSCLA